MAGLPGLHNPGLHNICPDGVGMEPPHPDMFDLANIGAKAPADQKLPEGQKL